MNNKIVFVYAFYGENKNSRALIIKKYIEKYGDVIIISSDFSHARKEKYEYKDSNIVFIKTIQYSKNISLKRIISHIKFSFDAIKEVKKYKTKLIYTILPPNILGYLIYKYCKKNKIKFVIDIIDLWPESMPINKKLNLLIYPITFIWKKIRTKAIKESYLTLTESKYFYDMLNLKEKENAKVVYLKKEESFTDDYIYDEKINIAYIGNIGKIMDIESLIKICKNLNSKRSVIVSIIGDGELKKDLICGFNRKEISYIDYGIVFDETEKQKILSKCMFGFNGYKMKTEVALSYKTIDYFSCNIPIINSAKKDTWEIVENYNVGFNYKNDVDVVNKILKQSKEEYMDMRKCVNNIFKEKFSYESLKSELDGFNWMDYNSDKEVEKYE